LTDEQLIQCLARGDMDAFLDAISGFDRLLWSIAGGILKNVGAREDVEECVSDVYIALWRNPRGFDPGKGSLKTYLAVMARSRALDCLRRLARAPLAELRGDTPAPEGTPDDALLSRELFGALRGALDALGEPEREILVRRYFFEEKPAEIALNLALPLKEVNNRLYQGKIKLRKSLEESI
jgi:RNA polymerase sigma-70 factor (ECF subfamily)